MNFRSSGPNFYKWIVAKSLVRSRFCVSPVNSTGEQMLRKLITMVGEWFCLKLTLALVVFFGEVHLCRVYTSLMLL